jgi:outer membrane receptor for ferric coprogen and ferric-rhodotorulic acid
MSILGELMDKQVKMKRLSVLVSLALPLWAQAQSGDAEAVLQQVQVSAQKISDTTEGTGSYTTGKARGGTPLDMSLRDTPQSVTVVTQQRITDQAMVTVTDVVNNATGVSVNQYETHRAGFTARGFDIDNLQIDGVPTTWSQPWSSGEVLGSLALYDRVEIVRGATGLMTGAGNPSASINLVHKRATSKELSGSVEAGIGSWKERRGLVDLSTPLNQDGTVRARVVGEYQQGDSWVDLQQNKSKTLYATIEADLTPRTQLDVGFSRQENDPKNPMWGGLPFWYANGKQTNWDVSKTTAADWADWKTSYNNAFANIEHTFDNGWKARASISHGDRRGDSHLLYLSGVPNQNAAGGMFAFAGSYLTHTRQDDVGLELSGPFTLGGRKHEAAFGYSHSKQDFSSDSRSADFGSASSEVGNFDQWNGATFPAPTWSAPAFYETSQIKQDALYGVARFSITDPLKLIVGARVSNYQKSDHTSYDMTGYTIKNNHEVTPYAGVVYDLNDTYSAYASYTSIFQPQELKDYDGKTLEPIKGKAAEAGIKGEFLNGRLNAAFAVFHIKQDNLGQAAGMVTHNGGLPEAYYVASEGATSKGVEFDLNGELARGWNASAGYSQFRAKDATGGDVNSIYPRRLLRVFTSYNFAGELQVLTLGGGVNWEGRTYTLDPGAPANTPTRGVINQDSFALVNLMARYEISKNLSAQLNVNNAFDKKHFGMFAAYGAITYAAPRTTSLTLKYKF